MLSLTMSISKIRKWMRARIIIGDTLKNKPRKSIVQLKQERRHQGTGPSTHLSERKKTHLSDHSTFLCHCFCCPKNALCQCATVSGSVPAFVKYYYFSAPWGHTSWMALFFDTRHIQEQSCVKYDSVGKVVFCMVLFAWLCSAWLCSTWLCFA